MEREQQSVPEPENEPLIRFADDGTIGFWYKGYEPFCLPENPILEDIIQKIEKEKTDD